MRKLVALGLAGVVGVALWWRKNPSACPYSQRFWVTAPHPVITRQRLRAVLEPMAGERIEENFTPVGRAYAGFSVLCCAPDGVAACGHDAALGTVASERPRNAATSAAVNERPNRSNAGAGARRGFSIVPSAGT